MRRPLFRFPPPSACFAAACHPFLKDQLLTHGCSCSLASQASDKTGVGLSYIPAAKPKLPGHGESYNPPKEYLPTEEERQAWEVRAAGH